MCKYIEEYVCDSLQFNDYRTWNLTHCDRQIHKVKKRFIFFYVFFYYW